MQRSTSFSTNKLKMVKAHHDDRSYEEEEYSELEESDFEEIDCDDSEEDPTYHGDIDEALSELSKLSIKNKSNSRIHSKTKIDDGEVPVSDVEEMNSLKLNFKDVKNFEEVQNIIAAGQVDKLKVEQCKIYLRKHGLRLTGKKDTLIRRIKEHVEILHGEGEKKYPPSSFVLNCKGDACMGDIVMFEQAVYEGYSIVSRSASGPPCGKRIVAGRIVKESYGAAKQQHTFTVEVLWSKGHKPLPPLHPLLIKGRNLYRLNTMRQRWEDEDERHRVLREKHNRGSMARSNREIRVQGRLAKQMLKGMRDFPKKGQNSYQCIDINDETEKINGNNAKQQQRVAAKTQPQISKEPNLEVPVEFKENDYLAVPRSQPPQYNRSDMPVSLSYHEPNLSNKFHQIQHVPRHQGYAPGSKENSFPPLAAQLPSQQKRSTLSCFHFNQESKFHLSDCEKLMAPGRGDLALSSRHRHHHIQTTYGSASQLLDANREISYNLYRRNHHGEVLEAASSNSSRISSGRLGHIKQQLCRYYPQGRCYYGNNCKFLHE